jgi:hypothetical protein
MRVARWGLMLLLVSPLATAAPRPQQDQTLPPSDQQQEDPLAAAARRARQEKKDQPKATKVWDNDSLPKTPGGINVVGQTSPAVTDLATPDKPPATVPVDNASIQASLSAAKEELQSLKTDLDILQRKYALDEQMYLSKPEYSSDKAGAAAMQDEKDQIDAKQQAIADAEKKVADLQAKLDAAVTSAAK